MLARATWLHRLEAGSWRAGDMHGPRLEEGVRWTAEWRAEREEPSGHGHV